MVTNMGAFVWPMLTFILSGKMGYDNKTIGLISAGMGLLFLPATYIGGKLADHFNKKKIIIIFDSITTSLFIICSFMKPGLPMIFLFVTAGIFATMEWPSFDALFIEASKPEERDKVFSLSYLGYNMGLMFGAVLGGFLYKNHLSLAFRIDGLTTITSTLLIVLFVQSVQVESLDEEEKNEYEDKKDVKESTLKLLWQRKPVLLMILMFMMIQFVYDQWTFTLPLYMEDLFGDGVGARFYGTLVSFNGFIVIVSTPLITAFLSKKRELTKVSLGVALFSVSYVLIINGPMKIVFFMMMFIFTLGEISNAIGGNPYVSRRIPASHRGRVSSYLNIAIMTGGLVGKLISGYLNDHLGFDFTLSLMCLVGLTTSLLVVGVQKLDKTAFPKLYE